MHEPYMEPTDRCRAPSQYERCRRPRCHQPPVADLARWRNNWRQPELSGTTWWAYCADHLADYNREVRDGRVWWRGTREPEAEP